MKTTTFKKMTMTLVLLAFVLVANAQLKRYVTTTGAGTNDGSSWENAAIGTSVGIQAQIDAVAADANRGEIRFAAGTYPLSATLTLKDGVNIIGGYPATPITTTNETRNLATNQTIFDGGGARKLMNAPDGTGILYTHTTLIDGVILQHGSASYGSAAAICYGFVMQNCIIRNNTYNSSSSVGGAIRIYRNSGAGASAGTPNAANCGAALINCIIVNNTTNKGAAAVSIDSYSASSIINCVIANNLTTDASLVKLRNTNSRGNYGSVYIGSYAGGSRVVNNIFYNNSNNGQKDCDKHLGITFYAAAIYNNYFDGDQAYKDSVTQDYFYPIVPAAGYGYFKNFTVNNNKCQVDYPSSAIFAAPNTIMGSSAVDTEMYAIYNSDWKLKAGAGCIDAGISTTAADVSYPYIFMSAANRAYSTILTDISGNARISGTNPDLGAYEFGSTLYNAIPQVLESGYLSVKKNTIEFQKAANTVEIYNMIGVMIHAQKNVVEGSSITLNRSGIYLVKLESKQGVKTQKVIVK